MQTNQYNPYPIFTLVTLFLIIGLVLMAMMSIASNTSKFDAQKERYQQICTHNMGLYSEIGIHNDLVHRAGCTIQGTRLHFSTQFSIYQENTVESIRFKIEYSPTSTIFKSLCQNELNGTLESMGSYVVCKTALGESNIILTPTLKEPSLLYEDSLRIKTNS
jgi:hypothetical protein